MFRIGRRFERAETGLHEFRFPGEFAKDEFARHDGRKRKPVPPGAQGVHERSGIDLVADRPEARNHRARFERQFLDVVEQGESGLDAGGRGKGRAGRKRCTAQSFLVGLDRRQLGSGRVSGHALSRNAEGKGQGLMVLLRRQ